MLLGIGDTALKKESSTMTLRQFSKAQQLARTPQNEFNHQRLARFDGFGLSSFQPVAVTLADVAELIRWQCLQFNGELNSDALSEIQIAGRHKFVIAD